ncbi:MAG: pyridoxal phosphate-dependent aminotransferase [Deltaproteobacteria bacterium]|nr:pyridoxal phosphate-dependent aminotransferase [Deltaproteobacteria bacterium]
MTVARGIQQALQHSSWIRRMFEAGVALKAQVGEDGVFDFSLGNPILEPPQVLQQALRELTAHPPPGLHRYMPNAGFPSTRRAVAHHLSQQEGVDLDLEDVVMTVGAAGALHVALRSILDPGNEVIVFAPYFVEYPSYIEAQGGRPVLVETGPDFDLDLEALARAVTGRTKAVLVNTPNNPTGRIYSQGRIDALGEVLGAAERRHGTTIYVLSDTPYAQLTYDGLKNPRFFTAHPSTLLAHSFSKDLGLAGERIGLLAISPRAPYREDLRRATIYNNRVLGFINAPSLMQLALERSLGATVDLGYYRDLRERLCGGLVAAGYRLSPPQGSFYVFPETPEPDDVAFCARLLKHNVLVVPGSGFGRAGHMRIAFCVKPQTVEGALPHFAAALREAQAERAS